MRKILVIGEKTSQVKKFVETLCGGHTTTKHAKYIYSYTGNWRGPDHELYIFTFLPLAGHITTIETPKGYGWGECDPLTLVKDPKALKVVNERKYVTILRKCAEGKDEIWLATDPDAEGDNIAYEALNILKPNIRKQGLVIRRIWNSSLTKDEIRRSFVNPRKWEDNLALAVQGRRFTDAWLGFAGTREVTRAARHVANVKVISLGRVQLPTLRVIVERDFEHETFSSKEIWNIEAQTRINGDVVKATHAKQPFSNGDEAKRIHHKISDESTASLVKVTTKSKKEKPPIPLNTTAAIALLSKTLKTTASTCMGYLEELYEKELISYPRTENKKFTDGFPHKDILHKLSTFPPLSEFIDAIADKEKPRSNGKKMEEEDHDPIHPTGEMKALATLKPEVFRAWDIITKHYVSHFMQDFKYSTHQVDLLIGEEPFVIRFRTIEQLGWREIADWLKTDQEEVTIPSIGEQFAVSRIDLKKAKTKPPSRITDSQLLVEMEKMRIGTKSSRPEIIKKLQERNYIVRKGTRLRSTLWGRILILSLDPIWPEVIRPHFTAEVERMMDLVASKQKQYEDMLETLRNRYIALHEKLKGNLKTFQNLLIRLGLEDQVKLKEDEEKIKECWKTYSQIRGKP
ncbi:MAG: hypothetical protein D6732_16650 [Methanobacteriota archaeon]|nr:MAG: hypothetical protein D6732_16650 [Euryarchaeota archaeon]